MSKASMSACKYLREESTESEERLSSTVQAVVRGSPVLLDAIPKAVAG